MNAISGFDRQCSGQITFNGIDLHKEFNTLKDLIGYVPQQDIIYENLTLHDMLYYTAQMKMPKDTDKAEIEKKIREALEMVELQEHAATYIRKLSGGQKKRVPASQWSFSLTPSCFSWMNRPPGWIRGQRRI